MARDLLYKPPVLPTPSEEEETREAGRAAKPTPAAPTGRGRAAPRPAATTPALGPERAEGRAAPPPPARADGEGKPAAGEPQATGEPAAGRAYAAPYFNRDVVATQAANFRGQPMRALRGSDDALDLRRVVLPPGPLAAEPEVLLAAGDQMGLLEGGRSELSGLLARLGQRARDQGMGPEQFAALMAQAEAMTEARIAALARMMRLPPDRLGRSATLSQAAWAKGEALAQGGDVARAGERLADRVGRAAHPLHRRMAKVLGLALMPEPPAEGEGEGEGEGDGEEPDPSAS